MRELELFYKRTSTGSSLFEEVEIPHQVTDKAIHDGAVSYGRCKYPGWEFVLWRDKSPVKKMK